MCVIKSFALFLSGYKGLVYKCLFYAAHSRILPFCTAFSGTTTRFAGLGGRLDGALMAEDSDTKER
jgi:hypothetical protein